MAGVKLWLPPSIVKFGCLIHDEQLSSNARRICRMVAVPSSQIALFVMLVPGKKSWLSSRQPCDQNTPQQHQRPPRTDFAARVVSTCTRQQQHPCACTTHTCCRQGDRYRHCAACGARSLRFSQRGNALPSEKNASAAKNSDLATTFDVRRGLVSSRARRARARPQSPHIRKA